MSKIVKVTVTGWKSGFKTVSAVLLLKEYAVGLKDSKQKIDLLLEGQSFQLELNDAAAGAFKSKMELLGGEVTFG